MGTRLTWTLHVLLAALVAQKDEDGLDIDVVYLVYAHSDLVFSY
jgi:hypothetical protein